MVYTRLGFCGSSAAYPGFLAKEATITTTTSALSGLSGMLVHDEEVEEG